MSTTTRDPFPTARVPRADVDRLSSCSVTARRHVAWLAIGIATSFLVSFVLADTLGLPRDLYYGCYGAITIAVFAGWMRDTGQSTGELLRRRWALGAGARRPRCGGQFAGALIWRGVFYGAVDGLLLSAFPILVVFSAFAGTRLRNARGGIVAVGVVAMVASLAITATYHLGYGDFRSEKLRKPVTGDLVWSIPTLATLNPVGAPIAHAGLHVAAVTHRYDTDVFLPPH